MRPQSDNRYYNAADQTRSLWACLIALALIVSTGGPRLVSAVSAPTQPTVSLQTADAPFLPGTFQVISNEPGNQTNAHVDCNLVSYTFDDFLGRSTVHYQDLSTGVDNIAPGNGVDLLSDVSGSRVAFTEVDLPGDGVVVFDTLSQIRTAVPGIGPSNPSIGGTLVAFEHRTLSTTNVSEIGFYDLSTGTLTQLTSDSLSNRNVSVSPNGEALVWEKCQTSGLGCDIYAALPTSPGVFATHALTNVDAEDRLPETNGELAVYVSNRSGEYDIYYKLLVGGVEVRLSLPGDQRDVTISGNLIAFESLVQTGYEIFVYDLTTSKLFQVTSTPGDETLSDLNVCNGIGRIVYTLPGDGSFDVHAFTFQPPSGTENQINDLISLLRSFNLPPGTTNSLITKLEDALKAIDSSDMATACSSLTAFINECQAQSGKKLTVDQATQLIDAATLIKINLGCQ